VCPRGRGWNATFQQCRLAPGKVGQNQGGRQSLNPPEDHQVPQSHARQCDTDPEGAVESPSRCVVARAGWIPNMRAVLMAAVFSPHSPRQRQPAIAALKRPANFRRSDGTSTIR